MGGTEAAAVGSVAEVRAHIHYERRFLSVALQSVMDSPEWRENSREGWLYAGIEKKTGLLKFGGTRMCPFCRASVGKFSLVGLCSSPDWRVNERLFLRALGTPVRGKEWFDQTWNRLRWLFRQGIVHPLRKLDAQFCREIPAPIGSGGSR